MVGIHSSVMTALILKLGPSAEIVMQSYDLVQTGDWIGSELNNGRPVRNVSITVLYLVPALSI